jgi:hypothetical protein
MKKILTITLLLLSGFIYCQAYILTTDGEKITVNDSRWHESSFGKLRYYTGTGIIHGFQKGIKLEKVVELKDGNSIYKPFTINKDINIYKVVATSAGKTLLAAFYQSDKGLVTAFYHIIDKDTNILASGKINRAWGKDKLKELESKVADDIRTHFGQCDEIVASLTMDFAINKVGSREDNMFFLQDKVYNCN